jgi:hypothetical protein
LDGREKNEKGLKEDGNGNDGNENEGLV